MENVQTNKPEALTNITNATYFGPIKLSPVNTEMPLQSRDSVLLVIVMVFTTVQLIKKLFQLLCEASFSIHFFLNDIYQLGKTNSEYKLGFFSK